MSNNVKMLRSYADIEDRHFDKVHFFAAEARSCADEIERLREALRKWDALIQYQYTGSREAMSALQACAFETDEILNRAALEEKE